MGGGWGESTPFCRGRQSTGFGEFGFSCCSRSASPSGHSSLQNPGPSENLTTIADLVRKRSDLSTQLQGTPVLRTPVAQGACAGARASGLRTFHRWGGGARGTQGRWAQVG